MLEELKNRTRPFEVPTGYFSTVEDQVRERIAKPEKAPGSLMSALRTTLAMTCTFLMIFGMGYGVMALTGTMEAGNFPVEQDELATLIEQGYIKHDFIDYLYDEIDMEDIPHLDNMEMDDELYRRFESEMSEMELMDHIENYQYE